MESSSFSLRTLAVIKASDLSDDFAAIKHLLAKDGGALIYHASVGMDPPYLVLVGDRAVYVYTKSGALQRCIEVGAVEEVVESGRVVGLRVPSEYDLRIYFEEADATHFIETLCMVYRRNLSKSLPVRVIASSEHLSRHLWLSPPTDWVPKPFISFNYDSGGNEPTVVEDLQNKQQEIERLRRELQENSSASAMKKLESLEDAIGSLARSIHETPLRRSPLEGSPFPRAINGQRTESPYSRYEASYTDTDDGSVLRALTVKLTKQVAAATTELSRLKEQSNKQQPTPQSALPQPMYIQPYMAVPQQQQQEGGPDMSQHMYLSPMPQSAGYPASPPQAQGVPLQMVGPHQLPQHTYQTYQTYHTYHAQEASPAQAQAQPQEGTEAGQRDPQHADHHPTSPVQRQPVQGFPGPVSISLYQPSPQPVSYHGRTSPKTQNNVELLARVKQLEGMVKAKTKSNEAMTLAERLAKLEGWMGGKKTDRKDSKKGDPSTIHVHLPATDRTSPTKPLSSPKAEAPQPSDPPSNPVPKPAKGPAVHVAKRSFWSNSTLGDSAQSKKRRSPSPQKAGRGDGDRRQVETKDTQQSDESWGNIVGVPRVDSVFVDEHSRQGHEREHSGRERDTPKGSLKGSLRGRRQGTTGSPERSSPPSPRAAPKPTPASPAPGQVHTPLLSPSPTLSKPVRFRCVTEGLYHTMRDKPSRQAAKVGEVQPGDEVDIVEQKMDSEGQVWVKAAAGGWFLQKTADNGEPGEFMVPVRTVRDRHLETKIKHLEDTQQCELATLTRHVKRLEETVSAQQSRMNFELSQQKEMLAFHQRRQPKAHAGAIQLMPPKVEPAPSPPTQPQSLPVSSEPSMHYTPYFVPSPVPVPMATPVAAPAPSPTPAPAPSIPPELLAMQMQMQYNHAGSAPAALADISGRYVSPPREPRSPRSEAGTRFQSPRSPRLRQLRSMSPVHPDSLKRTQPSVLCKVEYPQKLKRGVSPGSSEKWRIIGAGSAVRSEIGPDSKQIGVLPQASLVDVTEIYGNRVRIIKPMKGWVSLCSDSGAPLMVPSSSSKPAPVTRPRTPRSVLSPKKSRPPSTRKPFR